MYQCKQCGKQFEQMRGLRMHLTVMGHKGIVENGNGASANGSSHATNGNGHSNGTMPIAGNARAIADTLLIVTAQRDALNQTIETLTALSIRG